MKTVLVLLIFITSSAHAINDSSVQVQCRDQYSKPGSVPVITLKAYYNSQAVADGASITDVRFPNDQKRYEYFPRAIGGIFRESKITHPNSPYRGHYEYRLQDGIRLVLNADVTPEGFRAADVDRRKQNHGAVLDIDQRVHQKWSGGNFYIRMICESTIIPR